MNDLSIAGPTETITITRPPAARDKYGDPIPGSGGSWQLDGCLFAPGQSSETGIGEGSNQVHTDGTVYAPAGSDIRNTDQIKVRDRDYEVAGEPQMWAATGVVVPLRRRTG